MSGFYRRGRSTVHFHARRDGHFKGYRYQIDLGPIMPPHLMREHFHLPASGRHPENGPGCAFCF